MDLIPRIRRTETARGKGAPLLRMQTRRHSETAEVFALTVISKVSTKVLGIAGSGEPLRTRTLRMYLACDLSTDIVRARVRVNSGVEMLPVERVNRRRRESLSPSPQLP